MDFLSLFTGSDKTGSDEPAADKPALVGIARLAAEGESLRQGHRGRILHPAGPSPCSTAASACANALHLDHQSLPRLRICLQVLLRPLHPRIHGNARRHAISSRRSTSSSMPPTCCGRNCAGSNQDEQIALGTATDPYQPAERRFEVTRAILEEFARHRGLELGIVTKSNLVVRDLDLLTKWRNTTSFRSTSPSRR